MMERNSDGSYDAVDSGGFGKDYHGQDAFGERLGGSGIGGSHFGGKAAGDFSDVDELGEGHFTERYTDYGQAMATESPTEVGDATEVANSMRESIRGVNEETAENSNTDSMDTSFQIGGIEEDKEKARQEYERSEEELNSINEWSDKYNKGLDKAKGAIETAIKQLESPKISDKISTTLIGTKGDAIDGIEKFAETAEYPGFDKAKLEADFKERGTQALTDALNTIDSFAREQLDEARKEVTSRRDHLKSVYESFTDKTKTSFTDKMKPTEAKAEAKPGTNMANAKTSPSDYITKANKDSTKETAPSRNDFGNHAVDTLKGVTDRIADSTTADALGLKSVEEFARENGYNPEKLSTLKAYQSYQTKEIMKAVPDITKRIGGYIGERIKDAFDLSQLPERFRNTLARYNPATLIGALILSIKSGAGLQASIDLALAPVDIEDQTVVSDFLEDVLRDGDTVKDISNAIDGALAPEENSNTSELDSEIVNIGRKDNTDYDDFNAGLGSSGTTSDADAKVFIARNVKADPILRKMISKIGK